jgi:thiol-disulfide isomerase/thioredoxin
MKRRALAIAAAAGAAGLGTALWRSKQHKKDQAAAEHLWPLQFETPEGSESLKLAAWRGQPLLLNFWATWCPPCVRELPLLDQFQRDHQADGWKVLALAVDNLAAVQTFLSTRSLSLSVGMAGLAGAELARTLGNTSGSLPYTVVFDRAAELVDRKLGLINETDLQQWAARIK